TRALLGCLRPAHPPSAANAGALRSPHPQGGRRRPPPPCYSAAIGQERGSAAGGAIGKGAGGSSVGPTKREKSRQPPLAMSSIMANTAGTKTNDRSVDDMRPPITAIAIRERNSPPEPTP